jgi:predicted ribosomally synthesized peptide with SipW-like signal peptide
MEQLMWTALTRRDAKIAASVVVLVGLAVGLSGNALALLTDQDTIGSNTFTAGKIDLSISPTSAVISYSSMLAGDSTTSSLVVSNAAGSSALRYAVSSSATNADSKALKDQLVLTVKTIDVTTPGTPCDNFDGTQLYTGDLDSTAGKLVGDSAQGAQAGDRALAANGSETLCLRVSLPSSTGNAFNGATTTATFTFDAEQTANN